MTSVSSLVRAACSSLLGLFALTAASGVAHAQAPQAAVAEPPLPVLGEPAPMLLSTPPTSADDSETAAEGSTDKPRMFGAMFDLGVPDGSMLSFVYRPINIARFHAGAGYNGVSPGLRIGGALLPFGAGPSLSLDYGHYFEGDANGLAGLFAGPTEEGSVLLERVGYDFVSLRAGMELGGDRFTFFARGGVSWLRTTIHEFDALLDEGDTNGGNTTISVSEDPILKAFGPSFQLGLIVQI